MLPMRRLADLPGPSVCGGNKSPSLSASDLFLTPFGLARKAKRF